MNGWVRLWHDMPTDPKWRVIARLSGQPLPCVIALFAILMVEASRATPKGSVAGVRPEEAAAALDVDETTVSSILDAMQGRVVREGMLTGWERRQPKREDDSAERVRRHRAAKADGEGKRAVTQRNAPEAEADTDNSDADASGGAPPTPANPLDLKAAVFASGVPLLTSAGLTDRNARSMLGRWRQTHGDGAVIDALSAAQAEAASAPVPFINRVLETRNGTRRQSASRPSGPIESRRRFREQHGMELIGGEGAR